MNKKLLIFSSIIITIFLAFFVVGDLTLITLNAPVDDEVINGTYTFRATIVGSADYVIFYYGQSEIWTEICFNDTWEPNEITFICDNSTSQINDGTYNFKAKGWESSTQTEVSDSNTNVIIDNTVPVINLNDPINNFKFTSTGISLNYTPIDSNLRKCKLYGDWGGSWEEKDEHSPTSGSLDNFDQIISDGDYNWKIWCNDSAGHQLFSDIRNFSAGVPIANLIEPITNNWTNLTTINFTCSATDNSQLSSIILYGNWSGWGIKGTKSVTGTNVETGFIITIPSQGNYEWNCIATDDASQNSNWGESQNRTLTIDWTPPTLDIGVAHGVEYSEDEVNCSCYATDNLDTSISCSKRNCNSTVGDHISFFWAIDDAGNLINVSINFSVYEEPPAESEAEAEAESESESGYTAPTPVTAKVEEKCWDIIEAGVTIDYDVEDDDIGIRKITIIPKATLNDACLKVKQVISITTAGVTKYDDDIKVYKYFQIEPTGISDDDLTSVIIEFSIAKSFFYDHNRETTTLNRYKESWEELDTEDLSQDYPNHAYFKAESPGFSDFVVTAEQAEFAKVGATGSCGDGTCSDDENSTTCCLDCGCPLGYECIDGACNKSSKFIVFQWFEITYGKVKNWISEKIEFDWLKTKWLLGLPIWAWIIIGVVIVAIAVVFIFFRKKIKIKLPFEVNFSVHKKKYGFN